MFPCKSSLFCPDPNKYLPHDPQTACKILIKFKTASIYKMFLFYMVITVSHLSAHESMPNLSLFKLTTNYSN